MAADKGLYNKFKYRLGLLQGVAAKAATDNYKELMTSGGEAAVQAFMQEMVNTKGAAAEKIVRKKQLVDDTFADDEEGWVSFGLGATKEGWDCLLEMVEDGAVESRKNPKLKATSKIPYPKHLQVYLTESKKRIRTGTRELNSLVVEHDIVPEENEQFLKDFATKKTRRRRLCEVLRSALSLQEGHQVTPV